MSVFLTPIEVLVMHRTMVERYGGAQGLRDAGALEAALFRPQSGYYDDLLAEASALFESLAMTRPFLDGNKRVAFGCVDVFLRVNGWRIHARPLAIHKWMVRMIAAGTFDLAHIEPWLRRNSRPAPP